MNLPPPGLPERLLARVIGDPDWRDTILGDLREEYVLMSRRQGLRQARRWYWIQAMGVAAHRAAARLSSARRGPVLSLPEPPQPGAGRRALLSHDLRSAWRSLRHQAPLSATIVIMLALGLAANAAVFAMADALLLRPFRYPGVARAAVVASDTHEAFFDRASVAPGDFFDWREQTAGVFDRLSAIEWWDPQFLPDGPPQQLTGFRVSPELFEILGEPPLAGRALTVADARAERPVVVLGYEFWRRHFGGRPGALGQRLRLAGVPHEIVGIMPPSFRVPFGADVWAPLTFAPDARAERARGSLMVVGRLTAGTTAAQAEQRLKAILADQRRLFPDTHARRDVSAYTFTEGFGDPAAGPFIMVWQVAALLLLVVACANVANLLLARNTERQREFSVRLALGASAGRLTSQLLVEGALLAGAAAALALPLAWAALGAMRAMFPDAIIRFVAGWAHMTIEPRTFLVTAALAVVAVLAFAIAPALRAARQNVTDGLRLGGRLTDGAGRQRIRATLAAAQIAVTLALLVAAGLSVTALHRVTEGPIGFDPADVLVGRVTLPEGRYATPEARRQIVARVLDRLRALPAVQIASAASVLPYSGSDASTSFWREDVPPRQEAATDVAYRSVTPSTFPTLRVPLLHGRLLADSDRPGTPPVAVVSRSLAERLWPGRPAVGQRFRTRADGPLIMVVGVVGDVAQHWLVNPTRPTYYVPLDQDPPAGFHLVVRTATDPLQLAAGLRAAVQAEDPELPVVAVQSLEGLIADLTVGLRFAGRTLGVIAAASGLLSAIGIYSLMAFLTGRRTREMGVRMALGATRRDVVWLACRQAMRLILAGVGVGLVLAFLVGRGLEAAMFGVVTSSVALPLVLAALLAASAMAASYMPARRVSRVDPTIALRTE